MALSQERLEVSKSHNCPRCGECDVEGSSVEVEPQNAYQECYCGGCELTYYLVFDLSHAYVLVEQEA